MIPSQLITTQHRIETQDSPLETQTPPSDYTPESITEHIPPQIWMSHSPADQYLKELHRLGAINDDWELSPAYAGIRPLGCDVTEKTALVAGDVGSTPFPILIKSCYTAATLDGHQIEQFKIFGSYARRFVGHESLRALLNSKFPEVSPLANRQTDRIDTYRDIDVRIQGSEGNAVPNFSMNLTAIATFPLTIKNPTFIPGAQVPRIDVESVEIGHLVDVTFCRYDSGDQIRAAHQDFSVDLLPHLDGTGDIQAYGTLQGALDLLCQIGHWVKEKNQKKWDYCAYVMMITSGVRFPNDKAEKNLQKAFFADIGPNEKDAVETILSFNKVTDLSRDEQTLYILNHCQLLGDYSELIFELLAIQKPTDPFLKKVVDLVANKKTPYNTITALLQIHSMRLLLNDPKHLSQLFFRMELTPHKREPHLCLRFGTAAWMIPLNLKEAWNTVVATASEELVPLIKLCGPVHRYQYVKGSPLHTHYALISEQIDIPLNELIPHLASNNMVLKRLAWFSFLGQFSLRPQVHSFFAAIEYGSKELLDSFHLTDIFRSLLEDFSTVLHKGDRTHVEVGIGEYFHKETWRLRALSENLILVNDESLFAKALDWLGPFYNSFDAVKHHLSHKRVGKVIELLRVLQPRNAGDFSTWKQVLNEVTLILSAKTVTADNFPLLLERVRPFSTIVLATLRRFRGEGEWLKETEPLSALLATLQLHEKKRELDLFRSEWQHKAWHMEMQAALAAFKQQPDVAKARNLQDKYGATAAEEVRMALLEFVKYPGKNQKELEILVQECPFLDLFQGTKESVQLAQSLMQWTLNHINTKSPNLRTAMNLLKLELPFAVETKLFVLSKITCTGDSLIQQEAAEILENMAIQSNLSDKESFDVHVALLKIALASDPFDRAGIERRCEKLLFPSKYGLSAEGTIQLYSVLAHDPATDHRFKELLPTLVNARSNLPVKISRHELTKVKSRTDFAFAILLLRHYEPEYQDALNVIFDVVKTGGMSQDKHEAFKEALIRSLHDDNERLWRTKDGLHSLFELLITHLPANPRYAELIDIWIELTEEESLDRYLMLKMGNLNALFPADNRTIVPKEFLKIFDAGLSEDIELEELARIGPYVTTKAFYDHTLPEDYKRILDRYFEHFFKLVFAEQSHFRKISKNMWTTFSKNFQKYLDNYVHEITPQNAPLVHAAEAILDNLLSKKGVVAGYWLDYLAYEICYLMAVNKHCYDYSHINPQISTNQIREIVDEIVSDCTTQLVQLPIYDGSVKQMPPLIVKSLIESLLNLDVTEPDLLAVKNNALIGLFSKVNFDEDPDLRTLFDRFVFADRSKLDSLGANHLNKFLAHMFNDQFHSAQSTPRTVWGYVYLILFSDINVKDILVKASADLKVKGLMQLSNHMDEIMTAFDEKNYYYNWTMISRILYMLEYLWVGQKPDLFIKKINSLISLFGWDFICQHSSLVNFAERTIDKSMWRFDPKQKFSNFDDFEYMNLVLDFGKTTLKPLESWVEQFRIQTKLIEFITTLKRCPISSKTRLEADKVQAELTSEARRKVVVAYRSNMIVIARCNHDSNAQANRCFSLAVSMVNASLYFDRLNESSFYRDQSEMWPQIYDTLLSTFLKIDGEYRYLLIFKSLEVLYMWKKNGRFDLLAAKPTDSDQVEILTQSHHQILQRVNIFIPYLRELYNPLYLDQKKKETIANYVEFLFDPSSLLYISNEQTLNLDMQNFDMLLDLIEEVDPEYLKQLYADHRFIRAKVAGKDKKN